MKWSAGWLTSIYSLNADGDDLRYETQIQIFANWPMSHAKRVTRDNRKNPEYQVAAAIGKLRTDKNCPAGKSWPNHVKNEQQIGSEKTYGPNGTSEYLLVHLSVQPQKSSTAGAFAVPVRVSSRNNMAGDNVLFYMRYLLGVKNISSHAHKTASWYLLAVLFKISDEHLCPSLYGVSHPRAWSLISQGTIKPLARKLPKFVFNVLSMIA